MNLRKLSVWGFVLFFIALAVFSYFGNRSLFYLYIGLLIPFVMVHSKLFCGRCTNIHCAFNAKSPDYAFRFRHRPMSENLGYSDLYAPRAWVPFLVILAIPLIAIWQFSPLVLLLLLLFASIDMVVYQKESCRYCTNNCPNNRNRNYWKWKKGRDKR